jgi:hypothetical protein
MEIAVLGSIQRNDQSRPRFGPTSIWPDLDLAPPNRRESVKIPANAEIGKA